MEFNLSILLNMSYVREIIFCIFIFILSCFRSFFIVLKKRFCEKDGLMVKDVRFNEISNFTKVDIRTVKRKSRVIVLGLLSKDEYRLVFVIFDETRFGSMVVYGN